MEPRTRPNSSKAGCVSRNKPVKDGCASRCTGCLPTRPGSIRSKFGSVCSNANVCSPITLSRRLLWKPLSPSTSPITTKRPSRSTGPTRSRSLNRKSERIYDSLYLAPDFRGGGGSGESRRSSRNFFNALIPKQIQLNFPTVERINDLLLDLRMEAQGEVPEEV